MHDSGTRATGRAHGLTAFLRDNLRWIWPDALAMGLCQAVMLVPFLLGPLGLGLGALVWDLPWYTFSFFAALAATMLVNDRIGCHRAPLPGLEYTAPACAAFTLGSLLLAAHPLFAGSASIALGCAGAALMGAGNACAQLSSARRLATLNSSCCTAVVILSMAISACALAFAAASNGLWAAFLFAAFPAVGYALKRSGLGCVPERALATCATDGIDVLGSVAPDGVIRAGTVAGCAVATGAFVVFAARCELYALDACADGASALPSALFVCGLCILVLAVMAAACLKTKTLSMTFLYRLSLPLVMAGALVVALAPETAASEPLYWFAAFLACTAMLFIDQMVWITTSYFMRFDASFSEATASRFRLLQYAGAAVGALFSLPSVFSFGVMETMLVCTALLGCAFIVCIPTYEARIVSAGAQAPRLGGIDEGMRNRHATAFARYGLTAREAEVVCLMLQGLDAPGIARELVVSRATVNTHVRHVYEKTGVHCREELAALLGETPIASQA